ncbi:hypothetical protein M378DRAFT_160036 [Amanita muscaria Koide BX008]|uniref:CFEM domain-containing protein n=1 Tax=Amanita muscaria (strain Koide BX008) TaxID=946122 RepID=A0A0C2WZ27_AMAMK|nr:hypothetical protein M378DRAFT_160036 [Amanita muscaria Koide BX008]
MLVNARLVTLAALLTLVAGQTPSQCIIGCSQAALGSATNKSCKAITDTCVCTDIGFQTAAGQCLQKNCTAQDQQTATQLQKVLCGNTTATGSGSSNGTNSTSSASQSGSSTATGSAATTSQSSAAGAQLQAGQTGLFALGVGTAGAIVGGLLI